MDLGDRPRAARRSRSSGWAQETGRKDFYKKNGLVSLEWGISVTENNVSRGVEEKSSLRYGTEGYKGEGIERKTSLGGKIGALGGIKKHSWGTEGSNPRGRRKSLFWGTN